MKATVVLPILLFSVLFIIIFILSSKARESKHYDEMQLQIRKTGYKISFIVMVIMVAIIGILYEFVGNEISEWISPGMAMISVMIVGVLVLSIYSIVKDSFFAIHERGNRYMVLCAVLGFANLVGFISRVIEGEFLNDGGLTFKDGGANIILFVFFFTILVAIAVKKISSRKVDVE